MEHVLLFRSLGDDITDVEFQQFLNKLFIKFDKRQLLTKSLFFFLLNEYKRNETNTAKQINNIINDVIDLRRPHATTEITDHDTKDDNSNQEIMKKISFNDLPYILVSETASYLDLVSVSQFTLSNRHIAISCHKNPTTISSVAGSGNWLDRYLFNYGNQFASFQLTNITRFRMLKQIQFLHSNLRPKTNTDLCKLTNNLDNFILCGDASGYPQMFLDDFMEENQYLLDMLAKMIIKQLTFQNITIDNYSRIPELFYCNNNIQCLSINACEIQKDKSSHYMHFPTYTCQGKDHLMFKQLTSLKGLIVSEQNIIDTALVSSYLMKQLESLHIDCYKIYHDQTGIPYEFTNLKELCIQHSSIDIIACACANKLQRLFIWEEDFGGVVILISAKIAFFINACKTLEYVGFGLYDNSGDSTVQFMETLIGSLQKMNTKKINLSVMIRAANNPYRVHVYGDDRNILIYNSTVIRLERNIQLLVVALNKMVTKDFMLILILNKYISTQINFKNLKSRYNNYNFDAFDNEKGTEKKIVISNKNNQMAGYDPRWMYKCKKCCNVFY